MSDSVSKGSFAPLLSYRKRQFPESGLHHYTSFDAVKEILVSHTLHLTHAAFTSDPTELRYGLQIIDEMRRNKSVKDVSLTEKLLPLMYYHFQPYVFCLSESEDLLTQWEMYSGRNGCCITFDDGITALTSSGYEGLRSVIYKEEEQLKYAKYLNHERHKPEHRTQGNVDVNAWFMLSVVFSKNPVFSHENEWRIVNIVQQESRDSVSCKSGSRFLKPYVRICHKPLPVKKITVGPADEQDRLVQSIKHLTKMTESYENVVIRKSAIEVSPS